MHNIVKHFNKQTGDTIVEVMLAIIVIGGTLGGAFAIANRSTKTTQDNYERYQAQVIANNQAELLKQKMNADTGNVKHSSFNSTTTQECISDAGSLTSGSPGCDRGSIPFKIDIYCLNDSALVDDCSSDAKYSNYRIHVEWDSLNGGKDNVELFYGV